MIGQLWWVKWRNQEILVRVVSETSGQRGDKRIIPLADDDFIEQERGFTGLREMWADDRR